MVLPDWFTKRKFGTSSPTSGRRSAVVPSLSGLATFGERYALQLGVVGHHKCRVNVVAR